MSPNILTAIRNIESFRSNDLRSYSSTYLNRINAVGQQLEFYIKDAVCGSFLLPQVEKMAKYDEFFSLLGNQNNPPDFIIRGGDAYEIKKIQSLKASLALNNSPPKDRLHRDDPRVTKSCRTCEGGNWQVKDIFYVVGSVRESKIKYLFFVHGLCYAAERDVYQQKASQLKKDIEGCVNARGWDASKTTTELGRISRVDPLNITTFRVRGMWEIENPLNVFSYIYRFDNLRDFQLIALMTRAKFDSFPPSDIVELSNNHRIELRDERVRNPNNPAERIDAKVLTVGW